VSVQSCYIWIAKDTREARHLGSWFGVIPSVKQGPGYVRSLDAADSKGVGCECEGHCSSSSSSSVWRVTFASVSKCYRQIIMSQTTYLWLCLKAIVVNGCRM